MSRVAFARLTGFSERALANWETHKQAPDAPTTRRLRELERLRKALCTIITAEGLAAWLDAPNPAFADLKPLEVIERGELEGERGARLPHPATIAPDNLGLPQPLAAVTYYQRHRRRGALLIGAMTLMIMAVVLLIFSVSATTDATMVVVGELKQMSSVAALNQPELDAVLIAQSRTYPAVERVIAAVENLH